MTSKRRSFISAERTDAVALRKDFRPHIFIKIKENIYPLVARGHLSKYLRVYTSLEWRFLARSTEFDMVVALYRDHAAMEILKPFTVTGFEYHRGFDEMYAFDADGKIKGEVQ